MRVLALVSLSVLVLASTASALQAPQAAPLPAPRDLGTWWKNSEIVGELQLTGDQIDRIEHTFFDHRMQLIDLRAELEKEEMRLQPLMGMDQPDEAKVGAQIDRVLAARGRLEKANAMMMLAIRRILTVEQWKKLEEIRRDRARLTPLPLSAPKPPKPPSPPDPPPPL